MASASRHRLYRDSGLVQYLFCDTQISFCQISVESGTPNGMLAVVQFKRLAELKLRTQYTTF
jgi:hypothetical protein